MARGSDAVCESAPTLRSIVESGTAHTPSTRLITTIPAQHVKQKTKFYEACVWVRRWLGHEGDDAEGDRCISPIKVFLKTEATAYREVTAEDALRGTVGVWQGCAWRVRFKRCPTCSLEILMIESLWDLFDLEGKLKA